MNCFHKVEETLECDVKSAGINSAPNQHKILVTCVVFGIQFTKITINMSQKNTREGHSAAGPGEVGILTEIDEDPLVLGNHKLATNQH